MRLRKKLSAKEEFIGRRLRCPSCQSVLTIPKSSLTTTPVTPPRSDWLDVLKAATAAMAGKTKPPASAPMARPLGPQSTGSMFVDEPPPGKKLKPNDATPVSTPRAAQVALPLGTTPILPGSMPGEEEKHPWIDESLVQTSVPWGDGDDLRNPGPGPDRDWGTVVSLVGAAVIVAFGVLLVQ